jgi:7-cyano-7-deazaguanine synthase in queuosine biosynthesis
MTKVYVRRGGSDTGGASAVLDPSKNLYDAESSFERIFGNVTSLERDLLLLSAAIYAADRCIKRGERENAPRDIELSIPIVNIGVVQPCIAQIEQILRKLSSDSWTLQFRQEPGELEGPLNLKAVDGRTLLFSGGLDSLAAAIEFGSRKPDVQLVSHITHNQATSRAQSSLVSLMKKRLKLTFQHHRFLVTARSVAPGAHLAFDAESSQRTRSFLFLVLAGLCARRAGHNKILMIAENGQMAVHLPITQGRIGPFSTRTAHPEILLLMESLLNTVLGTVFKIVNPYAQLTKAEVCKRVCQTLPEAIPVSTSCWKSARLPTGFYALRLLHPLYPPSDRHRDSW